MAYIVRKATPGGGTTDVCIRLFVIGFLRIVRFFTDTKKYLKYLGFCGIITRVCDAHKNK